MSAKHQGLSKLAFSVGGIAVMAVLLIVVNLILSVVHGRLDMTEEKRYTLSDGTRAILGQIDLPVTIRFYYTREIKEVPLWMRNYAPRVRDLLKEYQLAARGNLRLEERNPMPDSEDEESANLDGVFGQMLANGEQIYFGLGFAALDRTAVIPVLSPQDESNLEYEITRAIFQLLNPKKPVVGVISSLPVMGRQPNMMMMQQGIRDRGEPAWHVITELRRNFDVREIQPGDAPIDADITVLLVIHPQDLTDESLFAIDQFVLRGGRLLAFLDPMSYVEMAMSQSPNMMQPPSGRPSTLGRLLDAWGIQFDTSKLLADLQYELEWRDEQGQFQRDPFILSIDRDAFADDDPTTNQLATGLLVYPGAFTGKPVDGLRKTVLVSSSVDSSLVDAMKARMSIPDVVKSFDSSHVNFALAIRLTGTFPTAFPAGAPSDEGDAPEADQPGAPLKSGDSAVVLVADADLLHDAFCVRRSNFLGQTVVQPSSDNIAFVHNLIDHLSGDSNLLAVRSRGIKSRPFTRIQAIRAKAEQQYQAEITKLEEELNQAASEIRQLQQSKSPDQRLILTPEQEAKLVQMRKRRTETANQLKIVRQEFRKDIVSLQTRLKVLNIAAVPTAVAIVGLSIALVKRRRMASK